jgi:hypothetical protein
MTDGESTGLPQEATGDRRLAILLAMAMFVLVVDTSLMNVSISAVVRDLDTTVSGVQSAIALEALVSPLNNYTLAPISEERVSEAAGVNSAAGSFGLSFGLAFAGAIMLATLSVTFTNMAQSSAVLPPDDQQRVAAALEEDAEVMTNTQLEELLVGQPEEIQDEIIRINTDARPLALQVALMVPILAGLVGLFNSFRMMRLPDPKPSGSVEGMAFRLITPPSAIARHNWYRG